MDYPGYNALAGGLTQGGNALMDYARMKYGLQQQAVLNALREREQANQEAQQQSLASHYKALEDIGRQNLSLEQAKQAAGTMDLVPAGRQWTPQQKQDITKGNPALEGLFQEVPSNEEAFSKGFVTPGTDQLTGQPEVQHPAGFVNLPTESSRIRAEMLRQYGRQDTDSALIALREAQANLARERAGAVDRNAGAYALMPLLAALRLGQSENFGTKAAPIDYGEAQQRAIARVNAELPAGDIMMAAQMKAKGIDIVAERAKRIQQYTDEIMRQAGTRQPTPGLSDEITRILSPLMSSHKGAPAPAAPAAAADATTQKAQDLIKKYGG